MATQKICALEGCNKPARRRFCCNKHKDRYHNIHNPRGRFRNIHFGHRKFDDHVDEFDDYYYATTHPLSSEALGQE